MIKYSIIIPVYGCEKYLNACVQSVLNQKGSHNYEIILVDDGSKDRSGEIADKLAEQYEQVKTVHKKNNGVSSARNRGIQEAKGKYILFIDADDTVDENYLENINRLQNTDEPSMIIFGVSFDYYRNDKLEYSDKLSCAHCGSYAVDKVFLEYKSFFYDNALSGVWNKVFIAEKIKRHGLFFNEGMTLYEDYDFVLRYLMCVESVICLDKVLYHYRNNLNDMHINHRVFDLVNVKDNLKHLLTTVNSIKDTQKCQLISSQLLDVSANLYLQFLMQNLMIKKYSVSELQESLNKYCDEYNFRKILASGANLKEKESLLIRQIDNGEFRQINFKYKNKRLIYNIKKILKQLLRKTGLRR
ncbi:MAG: glycosyltransferase family 2 protein [Ruminococcus sp.]|nr:glycosyltransferase family 2 protein [Ruminococcus sp.]